MAQESIHATAVVVDTTGLLLCGPSGSGKTQLALTLLHNYGNHHARLVADDRTVLHRINDRLLASAPQPIGGMVEQRFVGIVPIECMDTACIDAAVILDTKTPERLPHEESAEILGLALPHLRLPATDIVLSAATVTRWIETWRPIR